VIILALWLHRERPPVSESLAVVNTGELKLVTKWFAMLIIGALTLSLLAGTTLLFIPLATIFLAWTPVGFVLTMIAIVKGR
jgi:hypothetical protein